MGVTGILVVLLAVGQAGFTWAGVLIGAVGVLLAGLGTRFGFVPPASSPTERVMTMTRQALKLRAQGGDSVALGLLLAECQADARRCAMRRCTTSEIDYAGQKPCWPSPVMACHSSRRQRSRDGFFTVVRRECARMSRRMFVHDELNEDDCALDLLGRQTQDLRIDLAATHETLPPQHLEMILFRDFEEQTTGKICARLGVTVPIAKARLRRARLLVREYLPDADDYEVVPASAGT